MRPARVRSLPFHPSDFWIDGEIDDDVRAIAIVGSRDATDDAKKFAHDLAAAIAETGTVVLSGGAEGIDASAHRGALDAGGTTWCVAPTGHRHTFPKEHAPLYDEIVRARGTMIWPCAPDDDASRPGCFARRNGILVGMADAVVIVQAGIPSGTLNAASWCGRLSRPLYVVGAFPWAKGFAGSRLLLEGGARPLLSIDGFMVTLGLRQKARRDKRAVHGLPRRPSQPTTPDEKAVFQALGSEPIHRDELVLTTGLGTSAVSTALLTLALENVVVESPAGFFRRANPAQTLNIPIDIVSRS